MSQLEKNIAYLTNRIGGLRRAILSSWLDLDPGTVRWQMRRDIHKCKTKRRDLISELSERGKPYKL